MITKNEIKRIKNLQHKKNRKAEGLFIAEGKKTVLDLLKSGCKAEVIYTVDEIQNSDFISVTPKEMERITLLKSPSNVLGIFHINIQNQKKHPQKGVMMVLDGVTDPGNLGTIIRLCDWFGISTLICSPNTVDCYNPKVVQATMGSLSNVLCVYTDLVAFLKKSNKPIYGTFMEGDSIYDTSLDTEGILVMGSESHGISKEVTKSIQHKLTIPRLGSASGAESLNVALAAAIILGQAFKP
ncbi:MAG: RNA methyltransferase [Flavobacteriaceae bacterium]|nr:RNA methyltransferase [Flavobacteriaceae bacterium]